MNDQIQEKINGYLETLEMAVKSSTDFAVEQMPLLVQELLAWEFWSAVAYAISIGLLFVLINATTLTWYKKYNNWYNNGPHGECPPIVIGLCVFTLSIIPAVISIGWTIYALKVHIAPRLIVLEKISELIN